MIYAIFSFTGQMFPLAYQLKREGQDVLTCQIHDPADLEVDSWMTEKESAEHRARRLALYDGRLEKLTLKAMLAALKDYDPDELFVVFEHNACYMLAERLLTQGFHKGIFPLQEDFHAEKDREASKRFVADQYPELHLADPVTVQSVDEAVKFLEGADGLWVVKSDGNFGETIVPDSDDPMIATRQTISQLVAERKDYDQGPLVLEPKITHAIEFAPVMAFWDGEPIYSVVEIESRWLGAGDLGPQTGGNQTLMIQTNLDDPINQIAFPKAMRETAEARQGLFLADAGILSDGRRLYFSEFAGCRWGYPGLFADLSGSCDGTRMATPYFEAVAKGKNPWRTSVAASIGFYNLEPDPKHAALYESDRPIVMTEAAARETYLYQAKVGQDDGWMTVGLDPDGVGYVVSRGKTIEDTVESLYANLQGVALKGMFYRPKSDFLARDYPSAILNRLQFLVESGLITPYRGPGRAALGSSFHRICGPQRRFKRLKTRSVPPLWMETKEAV